MEQRPDTRLEETSWVGWVSAAQPTIPKAVTVGCADPPYEIEQILAVCRVIDQNGIPGNLKGNWPGLTINRTADKNVVPPGRMVLLGAPSSEDVDYYSHPYDLIYNPPGYVYDPTSGGPYNPDPNPNDPTFYDPSYYITSSPTDLFSDPTYYIAVTPLLASTEPTMTGLMVDTTGSSPASDTTSDWSVE